MKVIQVDDYCRMTYRETGKTSGSCIQLYWDHPEYPGQWSGRLSTAVPCDDYDALKPIHKREFENWDPISIILRHYNIPAIDGGISEEFLVMLTDSQLKQISFEAAAKNDNDWPKE